MKYKLAKGNPIVIAGVSSYDSITNKNINKNINLGFDFPNLEETIDMEAIRKKANKASKIINKNLNSFINNNFNSQESSDTEESTSKESNETAQEESSTNKNKNTSSNTNNDPMKNLGIDLEALGKGFEKTIEHFSESMGDWSNIFEDQMETFGDSMGQWGESFGKSMEQWSKSFGDQMNKHWNSSFDKENYNHWQLESLFNELYQKHLIMSEKDVSPNLYFELKSYDLGTSMNDQLTVIGARVDNCSDIPYAFTSTQLSPDQWLCVKLTKEEFSKDWMKELDNLDLIKDYNIEQYFMRRHFKNSDEEESKKIKVFIPLTLKK